MATFVHRDERAKRVAPCGPCKPGGVAATSSRSAGRTG
jgi:hypothetical protein